MLSSSSPLKVGNHEDLVQSIFAGMLSNLHRFPTARRDFVKRMGTAESGFGRRLQAVALTADIFLNILDYIASTLFDRRIEEMWATDKWAAAEDRGSTLIFNTI